MDSFLSRLFDTNTIQNGFLAQDTKQLMEMWNIREACNPSVALAGCVYKFDVSVPIEEYIDLAKEVQMTLMTQLPTLSLDVCVWGHVADGNAHINIVTPGQYKKDTALAKHIETTAGRTCWALTSDFLPPSEKACNRYSVLYQTSRMPAS